MCNRHRQVLRPVLHAPTGVGSSSRCLRSGTETNAASSLLVMVRIAANASQDTSHTARNRIAMSTRSRHRRQAGRRACESSGCHHTRRGRERVGLGEWECVAIADPSQLSSVRTMRYANWEAQGQLGGNHQSRRFPLVDRIDATLDMGAQATIEQPRTGPDTKPLQHREAADRCRRPRTDLRVEQPAGWTRCGSGRHGRLRYSSYAPEPRSETTRQR